MGIVWGLPLIAAYAVLERWLMYLGPIDLIAATLDVALGLGAVAWLAFTMLRSAQHRESDDPSK